MGNVSHRSKQKQQTSKKESQAKTTNGQTASNERKVKLTTEQASIFQHLIQAANEAQAQLSFAVRAAGLEQEMIVGGNLEGEDPFLIVNEKLTE
jgi:hypothetical protein